MPGRRLPPFAAIRAFEAAARHLSVKSAAKELCVTPSAISHQIKSLEDFLATGLFNRDGNRLSLTQTGENYLGKLTSLLDALDESTNEIQGRRQELRVLATPGFAARWLVPRLDRFAFGRSIRLAVSDGAPDVDFSCNDADVVIQWADSPVQGVVVEPLMASARYPVVSPELKAREGIQWPKDLLGQTLFHDEVMDGWPEWFQLAGLDVPELPRGPRFPYCELSIMAAERSQGVALGYDAVIRDTIRRGALVRLFETITMPTTIYSVAYTEDRSEDELIRSFRDWLFAEVTAENDLADLQETAAE